MKINSLCLASLVLLSISALEILVLDLGRSEVRKWYGKSPVSADKLQPAPSPSPPHSHRRTGPQNRQTFIRPTRPFLFPAVFSPTAFLLPAFVGKFGWEREDTEST